MNQHVRSTLPDSSWVPDARRRARLLAASMRMHFYIVHHLAPREAALSRVALLENLNNAPLHALTLADLVPDAAHDALMGGTGPVAWHLPPQNSRRFGRLSIGAAISIAFHNAHGLHLGLTLCDTALDDDAPGAGRLLADGLPLMEDIAAATRPPFPVATALTRREHHCLQWAAAGKTSVETAMILGLSPHTINQHLTQAASKLGAVNRAHAVAKAIRLGLLDLSAI